MKNVGGFVGRLFITISLFVSCWTWVSCALEEKFIVIVVASYNNEQWYERNLDSIFMQKYTNYHVMYIDDCSPDGTGNLVEAYIQKHGVQDRITLIKNSERRRHMANQYDAIHSVPDHAIIVICDGDDWFAHENVLQRVNEEYHKDAWLTFGQYWYWKKDRIGVCKEIPQEVLLQGTIRQRRPWRTSHLRTFYAGLYKRIKCEDLKYDGAYFPMCVDVATMMPMIEMASIHVHFIPDILYIYNDDTGFNFYSNNREQQIFLENEIRSRTPYKALQELPF